MAFPLLLMDIGSTAIKWCVAPGVGPLGAVSHERRRPDVPAGQQARAIADRYPGLPLRVCGSARDGVRVGLLGLTGRYSLAAARRAVLAAGCRLSYASELGGAVSADPDSSDPDPSELDSSELHSSEPVDVLVLVGGTDRGDHRHLSAALAGVRLDDRPHTTLVWAGAAGAGLELRPRHRVANVQDDQLRPTPAGLTALLRQLHGGMDSTGQPELDVLTGRLDRPVLPTSLAVNLAAGELVTDRQPVLVIDVGGTSTDLHYRDPSPAGTSIRQSFPELGLAGSRVALAARIAGEPLLYELVDAIAPADRRALYQRLRDADQDALAAPVGFLACLFAALKERGNAVPELPATAREPARESLDLAGAKVVVTGGACTGVPPAAIARVLDAATGQPDSRRSVIVDSDYQLWAHGLRNLAEVPAVSCDSLAR